MNTNAELRQMIETLQQEAHHLRRQIGKLNHPQGRVFVATRDSPDGEFTEQIPKEDASDLQDLTDGRSATGADTGNLLIRLSQSPFGTVPVLAYPNGATQAYVELLPSCDPAATDTVTLGDGTEGSEAANSTAFDFTGADISTGTLELWFVSRVGYFESGDKTIYQYMKKLTAVCVGGNLCIQKVSGETRVIVDVPVDCS